jgi:uncharacterized repeat protein (TIGR03803 family)
MTRWKFLRCALSLSAAAAFIAGCGAQPPINAPRVMPQTSALLARSHSKNYKVVYSFGSAPDGNNPYAGLVDVGGTLYGTTEYGGSKTPCTYYSAGCGTVFSITPSGTEKVLHSFGTSGDGIMPMGSLTDVKGQLYGTTSGGGSYSCIGGGCGTVFTISRSGKERVLYSFGSGSYYYGGAYPYASLIDAKGTLYGTTTSGGSISYYGPGTVFSISTSGDEATVYGFRSRDYGAVPYANVIDVKGTLYGTTVLGGANSCDCGAVFSVTTSGTEHVVYSFSGSADGAHPYGGLIDVDGTLYGTTEADGIRGGGTVFSISKTGNKQVLHSFGERFDGAEPYASLIDAHGTLYGTTYKGGAYGLGTVFSITTAGKERVLHSFGNGSDGAEPYASLIDVNGTLYGTTFSGGTSGYGTIFALTP